MIHALIIKGYGINCEKEMALACRLAGASPITMHAKDFFTNPVSLDKVHLLLLPGGFSFGDELGAAKAFANRLTYSSKIKDRLHAFVDRGGCILGVCNGFQLLVKLGLLPDGKEQEVSLANNDSLRFENRWAHHTVASSPCVFTKGLEQLYLPIRHGEGKLVFKNADVHKRLVEQNQIVFRYANADGTPTQSYPDNPNGSVDAIAGLCDPTGRVLGMMAHPEACLRFFHQPGWIREKEIGKRQQSTTIQDSDGLKLFKNGINYLKENL